MSQPQRVDPFAAADEPLDLADFAPAAKGSRPKPDKAALRAAAERVGFTSREPVAAPAQPDPAPPSGRPQRRATEQRQQFNVRAYPSVIDRLTAVADAKGWILAVAFEQAVAALEEQLAS